MGALEKFIEEQSHAFDVSAFMAPDAQEMDSASPPSSVYKYFSQNRAEFFRNPVIRFTQRTSLNDPFELTKRWTEFTSPGSRRAFEDLLKSAFGNLASQKGTVLEILKQKLAQKGTFLSPEEMAEASRILLSDQGRQHFDGIMKNAIEQIEPFIETAFSLFNADAERVFDQLTSEVGILSLSENSTNRGLWSLYASSGAGFVVEFDSAHRFFKAPNGRSLLRKVKYSNERVQDFWRNPLFLFSGETRGVLIRT